MKNTKILKKNYEILKVIKKGKTYSGQFLNFYILTNNEQINYLCVAVSKKTGNSVERNKIKRRIRENYRQIEESISTGYNIVIIWKKNADKNDSIFENIKKDFEYVLKKANILNK